VAGPDALPGGNSTGGIQRPEIALAVVTTELYNRATYLLIGGRVGKKGGRRKSRAEVTLKQEKE
jgi:hypothetical protein